METNLPEIPNSSEIDHEIHKELLRDEFKSSLYMTAKYLCGFNEITWRTHGDMIENLESETKRKLIVMPRGTFKSSIGVVAYSVWLLLRNPNLRILIDSEKYANSKNWIKQIRTIFEKPLMMDLFGDLRGIPWGEGEITLANRTANVREPSVVASGIEANKTGAHFDTIIADDLNTDKNSATPEGCQKVLDHYRLNISILEPEGTLVVIGTRYSALDVIGYILENEIENEKEI
jgi:hypothetical protein